MVPGPRDAARALGYGTLQHFRHGEMGVLLVARGILGLEDCIMNFGDVLDGFIHRKKKLRRGVHLRHSEYREVTSRS